MNHPVAHGALAFAMLVAVTVLARRQPALDGALRSSLRELPRLEYFACARSFSEVEQVRSRLEALSFRHLYAVQVSQAALRQQTRPGEGAGGGTVTASGAALVRSLEEGLREFGGTGQEPAFTQALLLLLAAEGDHDRWVALYLDFLYQRSTEALVGRFAGTAVTAGRTTGRLPEVIAGLRHVADIPRDFPGKREVLRALSGAVLAATPTPCPPTPHSGRPG